ncbi:MAG TPA: KUP/HAK/KT family potassium transporter, partial [Pseudobdellovibrionaceae bacterium]|nr:KUP/HAK/KT family potassium transporter [Pseudobdellovibrionaceae bacterium]
MASKKQTSERQGHQGQGNTGVWALTLGALGVVFGDIGTSPLYALRECFSSQHHFLALNHDNVLGVLSLIFWSLIMIISVKYVAIVLRADNKGEGGILSLMALLLTSYSNQQTKQRWFVITLGLIGAALLYGDAMITPAISVLSAVEGLSLVTPVFDQWVIPLAIFIINGIFLVQRFGTGRIGYFFGPIIFLWFLILGVLGIRGAIANPEVFLAISPLYAIRFFIENG